MSERKVLNKYYPPDFDPSKIPKLREPKNKTFSIRIMAPFNMRCNVCGEYIYKGKKFNSRKENVDDDDYLGLRIFRFYIRCPKCVAEIAFKTDLRNTDYTLEAGATRLFEAEKLAQEMAERERKEKEEEELNPMKVLENRTKASHKEMAQIDELEELREINARHAKVDTGSILEKQRLYEEHLLKLQQQEEDEMIQSIFGEKKGQTVKRLADSDSEEEEEDGGRPVSKKPAIVAGESATDVLVGDVAAAQNTQQASTKKDETWKRSVGTLSSKSGLAGLVKKKTSNKGQGSTGASTEANKQDNSGTKTDNAVLAKPAVKKTVAEANSLNGAGETSSSAKANSGTSSALGLLGGYSGSESDSDNSSN
ncbi:hypothetical protein BaRGS_00014473 [Batillaria attramentaria]|uniref:Splicing factor YJU2 n=1 Tax=Batillaria attramentaria TaxID=370345 RepID=A0ABD0L4S6_9CAEN